MSCDPRERSDTRARASIIELTLGVVAGNVFELQSQEWLDFIAAFASIVLTFLARMEVDTDCMRDRARATIGLGIGSFAGPFLVATTYATSGSSGRAGSLIAGTALSTTSLAVVYAVLVERDLRDTRIGKLLMSATFVTDLCTGLASRRSSSRRRSGSRASSSSRSRSSCCCRGSRPVSSAPAPHGIASGTGATRLSARRRLPEQARVGVTVAPGKLRHAGLDLEWSAHSLSSSAVPASASTARP